MEELINKRKNYVVYICECKWGCLSIAKECLMAWRDIRVHKRMFLSTVKKKKKVVGKLIYTKSQYENCTGHNVEFREFRIFSR